MHVSALNLLDACPSSQLSTDRPYNPQSDAADLGRAAHVALGGTVIGVPPDIAGLVSRYGVPESELRMMSAAGSAAWHDQLQAIFPVPQVEVQLEADTGLPKFGLRGRADVLHTDGETMAVLDWKTSRQRSNVKPQLRGYAYCAVQQYGWPLSGHVQLAVVWLRLGEIDLFTFREDDAENFIDQYRYDVADIGRRYAPGDACTFCQRQLVCGARSEYLRSAAGALQVVDAGAELTNETLLSLYPKAQMLERALKQYRSAVRLALRDGPVRDLNGNQYSLEETKRETIKAREAWPILQAEGFDEDDFAACVSMSTTAVLDCAAKRAPRGQKGKRKQALRALLRERGAVTEVVHDTVRMTKAGGNR